MPRTCGRCIGGLLILILVIAPAFAADPWPAEGERLYTQEHMARLVAEALADKGGDPDAIAVEFSPALATL